METGKSVKNKIEDEEERPINDRENMWEGLEIRLMFLISEMLNFTIEFKNSADRGYGVVKDLRSGNADAAIGGIVLNNEMIQSSSFSYPEIMDYAGFVSLASIALPKYRAIMGPFLWDVWIAITMCYIFAIIPMAFSAWHTLKPLIQHPGEIENMFWYVFGTFTNCFMFYGPNSWIQSVRSSTKLFIGTYWVFTIIITACYTGSIIAFITLPVYPEVVDAMHQLLHNNYRVFTMGNEGWWDLLNGSEDDEASGLAGTSERVLNVLEGLSAVVESAKVDNPVAFLGSSEQIKHMIQTKYTTGNISKRQMFHISKQCFVPQMITIILKFESDLVDSFNKAVMKAAEAGFIKKIQRDLKWDLYKGAEKNVLLQSKLKLAAIERQLTLEDTQGMFLLLGCGFTLALVAFAFEIGTWIKNRDGKKLSVLAKQRWLSASTRISTTLLAPTSNYMKQHFPLYFRHVLRRKSSLFGSIIFQIPVGPSIPPPSLSDSHLKPPSIEKPIRMLSF